MTNNTGLNHEDSSGHRNRWTFGGKMTKHADRLDMRD